MNKLIEIVNYKKVEIEKRKKNNLPTPRFPIRNFLQAFPGIIAEIKKASPSQGTIVQRLNIESQAQIYNEKAQAISVLTDHKFFQGDLSYIQKVKNISSLPVLQKDFIIDSFQIKEARAYGADAILLIAAILSENELKTLTEEARAQGLAILFEIHDETDLNKVLPLSPKLIGINNRDLTTFKINLETTKKLAPLIPDSIIKITESGITSLEDFNNLRPYINGALIGTALMQNPNLLNQITDGN